MGSLEMSQLSLPQTRNTWRAVRRGSPRQALRVEHIPMPKLEAGEVLVRVQAAALNPMYVSTLCPS